MSPSDPLKVLLVEEYPGRERLALLCLQHILERRGHSVCMTNAMGIEKASRRFRPDVVVDNISDSVYQYLGKWSFLPEDTRNVNLCWEQLLNPLGLPRYRFEESISTRLVDGRTSWGENFREVLLAENPEMDGDRIRITGSMKVVVQQMLGRADKHALSKHYDVELEGWDRLVLVAESFRLTEFSPTVLKRRFRGTRSAPYLYEFLKYASEMQKLFIQKVVELAEALPDVLFIVRVHPGKNPEYYKRYESQFPQANVQINSVGDIGGLIRIADVLLASRSGTLIDAHAQGVPALNLLKLDDPLLKTGIFETAENEFGMKIDIRELDAASLMNVIGQEGNGRQSTNLTAIAEGWLGPVDVGVFARVAEWIEEVARLPALPKRPPVRELMSYSNVRRMLGNRLRQWGLWNRGGELEDWNWYMTLFEEIKPQLGE